MRFLIIGIICIIAGIILKTNPEFISSLLDNKENLDIQRVEKLTNSGNIILVCGILLIIVAVLAIVGKKLSKKNQN